jgi:hypothetical protein
MKNTPIAFLICTLLFGCSDSYPELGGGYKIVGEGGYTASLVDSSNTQMIPAYILDYANDSCFILVAQSPFDSLPKMRNIIYTDKDRRKIAANESVFRNYWIIDKNQRRESGYDSIRLVATYSNVYGPFTYNNYLKQREILKVPKELEIE